MRTFFSPKLLALTVGLIAVAGLILNSNPAGSSLMGSLISFNPGYNYAAKNPGLAKVYNHNGEQMVLTKIIATNSGADTGNEACSKLKGSNGMRMVCKNNIESFPYLGNKGCKQFHPGAAERVSTFPGHGAHGGNYDLVCLSNGSRGRTGTCSQTGGTTCTTCPQCAKNLDCGESIGGGSNFTDEAIVRCFDAPDPVPPPPPVPADPVVDSAEVNGMFITEVSGSETGTSACQAYNKVCLGAVTQNMIACKTFYPEAEVKYSQLGGRFDHLCRAGSKKTDPACGNTYSDSCKICADCQNDYSCEETVGERFDAVFVECADPLESDKVTIEGSVQSEIGPPAVIPDGSGHVEYAVTAHHPLSLATKIQVQYSVDGGKTYHSATILSAQPDSGSIDIDNNLSFQIGSVDHVDTNIGSVTIDFVWDSRADGVAPDATIQLRVSVEDTFGNTTFDSSSEFNAQTEFHGAPDELSTQAPEVESVSPFIDTDVDGIADGAPDELSTQAPEAESVSPFIDTDGDEIADGLDPDIDGDGIPNGIDEDVDGDGTPNTSDEDIDGDGTPNGSDQDVDGDGIPNESDEDVDGDGIPNGEDSDIDGDNLPNGQDNDTDGDGALNRNDNDVDGDGILNANDPDVDGDGIPNTLDEDIDGDGALNGFDGDVDGDGIPNSDDPDVDGDNIPNGSDGDVDGDGIPNSDDPDVDGDGQINTEDSDIDGDGSDNDTDPDQDGDGSSNEEDSDPQGSEAAETVASHGSASVSYCSPDIVLEGGDGCNEGILPALQDVLGNGSSRNSLSEDEQEKAVFIEALLESSQQMPEEELLKHFDEDMTRAEAVEIAIFLLSYYQDISAQDAEYLLINGHYPDVPGDLASHTSIARATGFQIVIGYPDGYFRPQMKPNLAEISQIAVNLARIISEDINAQYEIFAASANTNWFDPYVKTLEHFGVDFPKTYPEIGEEASGIDFLDYIQRLLKGAGIEAPLSGLKAE